MEVLGSGKSEFPSLRRLVSTSGDRRGEAAPHSLHRWLWSEACSAGDRPAAQALRSAESPSPHLCLPTPQGGGTGAEPLRAGPAGSPVRANGLRLLWTLFMEGMCLQLQIPTEKDKGHRWGEIPGPHFSCCSCGLKPLNLASLPREGFYTSIVLPQRLPSLAPTCPFRWPSFPDSPQETCGLGKSRRHGPGPEDFCSLPSRDWVAAAVASEGWRALPSGCGGIRPSRHHRGRRGLGCLTKRETCSSNKSTYCVPSTILRILHALTHQPPQERSVSGEEGSLMGKVRHRAAKGLAWVPQLGSGRDGV